MGSFKDIIIKIGDFFSNYGINIVAAILVFIIKPFKKGDHISVGSCEGIVKNIKILTTEIYTFDNKKIVMPNSSIVNNALTNYTANPTRRADIVIGVSYDSDVKLVKRVLYGILVEHTLVLDIPKPAIIIKDFGDSSIDFQMKFWTKTDDYYSAINDIKEIIIEKFRESNIEIPYNKLDVQLIENGGERKWR